MSTQELKPSFFLFPQKNTTNTNELWTFEYQKDQTTVTDTLGRETIYQFDADHYYTAKIDPLHQSMQMHYDSNGQLIELKDVTGKSTTYSYDANGLLTANSAGMQACTLYLPSYPP